MIYKKILFAVFLITSIKTFSQTVTFKGKVLDTLQQPLVYANIIAEPKEDLAMQFAFADEQGSFQLKLQKDKIYTIKVSFLGYKPKVFTFLATKNTVKNIVLTESENVLEEVTINASLAVIVKEDTISYKTKHFVTGEERKLRDVLKKLPGVEVDRKGNVTVQGRRVTKVLVENKQFFTGDSKLAVNNIPADVVNEIEILDNYTDVAILKGLEDSNDLAMNIKLKEDKKKFWFGDVETGGGVKNRYLVHPSLFYYSPKRSVNFIGDFNNTGKKSFTFKDYLDFEGGYSKILLNTKMYFSLMNDDFAKFLTNQDFKSSKHTFGGANITESISNKTDLIGYVIYSKSDNELENQTINQYNNTANALIERRVSKNNPINQFVISKLGIENTQEDGSKLKLTSFLKSSNNKSINSISTNFNSTTKLIGTDVTANNITFKQNIEWYKSITKNQTITLLVNYQYDKGNSLINWNTNNFVFQNNIPVTSDSEYSIFKNKNATSQNGTLLLKDYWVLADFVHLYTTIGAQIYFDDYMTDEYQLQSNGTINNFNNAGFGNDIHFNFTNLYSGIQLKFQKGEFIFKPGVFYHQYLRKLDQINSVKFLDKKYVLPELSIEYKINRSEKLNFRYNLKVKFPSVLRLANQYTLTNFNSIYQGNDNLENELYHQLNLYYYKFSMFKKLNYNLSFNYTKKEKSLKGINQINGISYITQPIILDNADENLNFNGSISKGFNGYNLFLNSSASFSNYLQFINTALQRNKSTSYSFGGGVKTAFMKFPNIELNYNKSFSNYRTINSTSKFENNNLQVHLEYDFFKNFIFNADYTYDQFINKEQQVESKNDLLHASLFYQKENSPWGFEVSVRNLFDTKFKRQSSFSDFLFSDTKIFVLPRMFLFTISYKL